MSSTGNSNSGPERDSRVRSLFEAVAGLDQASRSAQLSAARGTDPDIAGEVEDLLRFHDNDSHILDRPVVEAAAEVIGAGDVPVTIGGYRVLREIGQGGMGVVYEGEQDFPHRRVALKVLRPELVTGSLLRRFTHEAEALSVLRHPGIAQLFEAGFADGERRRRPFIAMELVEGRPLSAFAKEQPLSPKAAMELLALVCDAVDHAHKRGVIHRDLKPGNILVGADGQPRVLDFGIARLTAPDRVGQTVATSLGQIMGTVGYMSPEQFSGDPTAVDARSDVYALGVMLYELLAGRPPVDVRTMSLAAAGAAIQGAEPPLLGTVSPALRGDVESIAAKALEKDPSRRYQSAAELAADIRRHLSDEAVLAHPQTSWYQARKFARRNKVLVALALAGAAVLTAGVVSTSWQAVRATRASKSAEVQATINRQRADFLTEIIKAATPDVAGGREITVREMLESASKRLSENPDMDPMVVAETHRLLTEAYTSLGDGVKSEEHARAALDLHTRLLGPDHPATIKDAHLLGSALSRRERNDEAITLLRQNLERSKRVLGTDNLDTIGIMQALGASLANSSATAEECRAVYEESWHTASRAFGPDHPATVTSRLGLAFAALAARDLPLAESLSGEVVEVRTRTEGPDDPDTLAALQVYIYLKQAQLKWEEYDREAPGLHARMCRVLGENHAATIGVAASLAERYRALNRCPEALPIYRAVLRNRESSNGIDNMHSVIARHGLISCLIATGAYEEAGAAIATQQSIIDAQYKPDSYMTALVVAQQYWLAKGQGDEARAETWASRLRGTRHENQLEAGRPGVPDHSTEGPVRK